MARAPIEQEIRLEYVDIPDIHCFSHSVGQELFEALSKSEEMELFENKAIQKVIQYKWPLVREFIIKRLFVPYIIFMVVYLVYMNWIYYERNNPDFYYYNYGAIGLLFICVYYFISLEFKQLRNEGFAYLASLWNYLDLIPPFGLLVFLPLELVGVFNSDAHAVRTLEAGL